MNNLTAIRLLEGLHQTPSVRIYTELDSLKNHQLLSEVRTTKEWMNAARVDTVAWNKARLLLEYKGKRHIDPGALNRIVMSTYKRNHFQWIKSSL